MKSKELKIYHATMFVVFSVILVLIVCKALFILNPYDLVFSTKMFNFSQFTLSPPCFQGRNTIINHFILNQHLYDKEKKFVNKRIMLRQLVIVGTHYSILC